MDFGCSETVVIDEPFTMITNFDNVRVITWERQSSSQSMLKYLYDTVTLVDGMQRRRIPTINKTYAAEQHYLSVETAKNNIKDDIDHCLMLMDDCIKRELIISKPYGLYITDKALEIWRTSELYNPIQNEEISVEVS